MNTPKPPLLSSLAGNKNTANTTDAINGMAGSLPQVNDMYYPVHVKGADGNKYIVSYQFDNPVQNHAIGTGFSTAWNEMRVSQHSKDTYPNTDMDIPTLNKMMLGGQKGGEHPLGVSYMNPNLLGRKVYPDTPQGYNQMNTEQNTSYQSVPQDKAAGPSVTGPSGVGQQTIY